MNIAFLNKQPKLDIEYQSLSQCEKKLAPLRPENLISLQEINTEKVKFSAQWVLFYPPRFSKI